MRDQPTVAISRQRGSGGSYIGRLIAERLGLRYIDRDLLRIAAEYLNEQEATPTEPRLSFWARLEQVLSVSAADGVYCAPSPGAIYEADVFKIESRLIREIVDDHAAVIVGRGAAQILRGRPDVLTVFLHASEPWRVERAQQVYQVANAAAARQMVLDSDRDRGRMIRSLADVEWTDVRAYDLAVDTAAVGLETAADVIVRAVASRTA